MKKINTYLMMALMAMTVTTVSTSCERFWEDMEDREEALTLEGTWKGYIDTYYEDRWGLRGDSYRTAMYFERENSYGGWGYELDYDQYDRNSYYYCEFRWEVVRGAIRIQYADSWNDVYIYDYSLSSSRFAGSMDDGVSNSRIDFLLYYDSRFEWDYWTRGATRGAADNQPFRASGAFAKTTEEASE